MSQCGSYYTPTLLLVALLLAFAGTSIGRLGISLSMQALGFAPAAVASTAIVSGLLTIPLALALGTLADQAGGGRLLGPGVLLGPPQALLCLAQHRFELPCFSYTTR